jgi:hypothetical protein
VAEQIHPVGPPRPTVVAAGCDPALPLLEDPLSLPDPHIATLKPVRETPGRSGP